MQSAHLCRCKPNPGAPFLPQAPAASLGTCSPAAQPLHTSSPHGAHFPNSTELQQPPRCPSGCTWGPCSPLPTLGFPRTTVHQAACLWMCSTSSWTLGTHVPVPCPGSHLAQPPKEGEQHSCQGQPFLRKPAPGLVLPFPQRPVELPLPEAG